MSAPRYHDMPELVGRERELAALREALVAAFAGHGGLVLLGGEAGVGKTTLAEALCAEAMARQALVLRGRCYDLTETPPYGPWAEAFGRAPRLADLPALPASVLPPEAGGEAMNSQEAVFARVGAYLAALAARQPHVLLLDDLHWADPASLALLRYCARQVAGLPALLLIAYRADELTRRHPLYALFPALVRESGATRLDLRRLGTSAVAALVTARYALAGADHARLVAYLQERTEGNALYLDELLRAIEEEGTLRPDGATWQLGDLARARVPSLLRQVIDGRVARLGEDGRAALTAAAVIGQDVPFALWTTIAAGDEESLLAVAEQASDAHLVALTEDGAGFRFAHALIREALYEGLTPLRRRVWHRQVAETLVADPRADPDAVANHFQRAGDARAADWLARAGDRARLAYAWTTAAARYEAALALLGEATDHAQERANILYRLGVILRFTDARRGIEALDEAVNLLDAGADPALAARLGLYRGILRCVLGDLSRGLAFLREAAADLEALSPAARDAAILDAPDATSGTGTVVLWLAVAGHLDEAEALGDSHLAAVRADLPGRLSHLQIDVLEGLGLVYLLRGRTAEAHAATIRAAELCRAVGHRFLAANSAFRLLIFTELVYRADNPAALESIAALAESDWRAADDGTMPFMPELARVPILALHGAWDEAFLFSAQVPPSFDGDIGIALAQVAIWRGQFAHAAALIGRVLPDGPLTRPGTVALPHLLAHQPIAAMLALATGDLDGARAWLAAHERALAWGGATWGRAAGEVGWAAYHRAAGDNTLAREFGLRALASAAEPRQPLVLLAAHRLVGELDTEAERRAEAHQHLADALALADACAAPHERALCLLALAELRAAEGQRPKARDHLADAGAILRPLDARPAIGRADALAARLASRTPQAGPSRETLPFGLTAREAEVLRLVAQGLGNLDIAEQLSLSRRTVEQHLRSVYDKLGVENRAAATRLAVEHDLT